MDDFQVLARWLKSSADELELRAARAQLSPLLLSVGRHMETASDDPEGCRHVLVYLRCLYLELERLDEMAVKRLRSLSKDDRLRAISTSGG